MNNVINLMERVSIDLKRKENWIITKKQKRPLEWTAAEYRKAYMKLLSK